MVREPQVRGGSPALPIDVRARISTTPRVLNPHDVVNSAAIIVVLQKKARALLAVFRTPRSESRRRCATRARWTTRRTNTPRAVLHESAPCVCSCLALPLHFPVRTARGPSRARSHAIAVNGMARANVRVFEPTT